MAIVCFPHVSNLDEFEALRHLSGVQLTWARSAADLRGAGLVILPGSKQVSGDLAWLRRRGLDAAIAAHAARGGLVLGLCGGLQMLGEALSDPDGHDGEAAFAAPGLGLLPLVTRYTSTKRLRRGRLAFGLTQGAWAAWGRLEAPGYEIHCGVTRPHPELPAADVVLRDADGEPLGWQSGPVLGLYAHGLLESPVLQQALWQATAPSLDTAFDLLADNVERHLDAPLLDRWIGAAA